MVRRSSTLFLFGALLFVNLVLSSSAVKVYTITEANLGKEIFLHQNDFLSQNEKIPAHLEREERFIGDLEVGQRIQGEDYWQDVFEIDNQTNQVANLVVHTQIGSGRIHYVGLINLKGSSIIFCPTENMLGGREFYARLRIAPRTKSAYKQRVGYF